MFKLGESLTVLSSIRKFFQYTSDHIRLKKNNKTI